jgi:hypothetical protein
MAGGLLKLRVRRKKLLDGSEPSKATRGRNEATQRVAISWCIRCLIEGPGASSSASGALSNLNLSVALPFIISSCDLTI